MSTADQPRDANISNYLPENWLPLDAVNRPTVLRNTTIATGYVLSTNSIQSTSGGNINVGTYTSSDVSINGRIIQPLRIQYTAQDDSDVYMGAYKTGTYVSSPALSFVNTVGNTNIRIAAHIDGLLAVGVYQVNVVCSGVANKLSPFLSLIGYTKTVLPQWVDGALLTGGTTVASINWTGRQYTTSTSHGFTLNVSGILKVSPKVYFCVGVTNQDNDAMTFTTDTTMTITRIG